MKRLTLSALSTAAALLAGASLAVAQPGAPMPPQPPPDDLDNPPDPVPTPDPVPEPRPDPAPTPVTTSYEPPAAAASTAAPRDPRPTAFSVGIGLGWDLPTDIQLPNATSVRFRIPSGWTLEPAFALQRGESSVDDGVPPPNSLTSSRLMASLLLRKTLRTNGKADLDIVGGLALENEGSDPDGEDNSVSTTQIGLVYGLAVGYWITPHVQFTMTAINPVVVQTKRVEELGTGIPDIETTSSSFGLVFDPNVIAMVHLHF